MYILYMYIKVPSQIVHFEESLPSAPELALQAPRAERQRNYHKQANKQTNKQTNTDNTNKDN